MTKLTKEQESWTAEDWCDWSLEQDEDADCAIVIAFSAARKKALEQCSDFILGYYPQDEVTKYLAYKIRAMIEKESE